MPFGAVCFVLLFNICIQTVYSRYDFDEGAEEHELVPPVIQALAAQPIPKDPLAIDDFRLHALSIGHLIAELLRHEIRMMSRLTNTGIGSLDLMKVNVTEAADSLGVGHTGAIAPGGAPVTTTVISTYAGASPTVTLSTQTATNQPVQYDTQQTYPPPAMAPGTPFQQQTGLPPAFPVIPSNNAFSSQQAFPNTNPLSTLQSTLTTVAPQPYVQPASNPLPQQATPLPALPGTNYPSPIQPTAGIEPQPITNPLNGYQVPPVTTMPQAYAQPAIMTPSNIIPPQTSTSPALPVVPEHISSPIQPTTEVLAPPVTNSLNGNQMPSITTAPQTLAQPGNPETQSQTYISQTSTLSNVVLPTTTEEAKPSALQTNTGSVTSSNLNPSAESTPANASPESTTLNASSEPGAITEGQNVPAHHHSSYHSQPFQSQTASTQPPMAEVQNPINPSTSNANGVLSPPEPVAPASLTPPPAAQPGGQPTPPTADVVSSPQPVATPPVAN